jgi:hypothetical protein
MIMIMMKMMMMMMIVMMAKIVHDGEDRMKSVQSGLDRATAPAQVQVVRHQHSTR